MFSAVDGSPTDPHYDVIPSIPVPPTSPVFSAVDDSPTDPHYDVIPFVPVPPTSPVFSAVDGSPTDPLYDVIPSFPIPPTSPTSSMAKGGSGLSQSPAGVVSEMVSFNLGHNLVHKRGLMFSWVYMGVSLIPRLSIRGLSDNWKDSLGRFHAWDGATLHHWKPGVSSWIVSHLSLASSWFSSSWADNNTDSRLSVVSLPFNLVDVMLWWHRLTCEGFLSWAWG